MTTTQRSTVVGVFHEREQAREAIEALKTAGFAPDSISILSPDKQATQDMAEDTGTHAGSAAATGAVAGGILGGLGGWLLGIGALAIPGIGPFIAAGAFATALGGAAIGAGVGAIAGALTGMGVPKEEAEYYEGEVKSGRTLVAVRADGRYDEAQRLLRHNGAYDVESKGAASADRLGSPADRRAAELGAASLQRTAGEQTVQLREEELQARKQSVQTGEVTVGKEVVSEQRTLEVPVTREEVVVERYPVEHRPADRPMDERPETIEVPVREEQVTAEKRAVVYEEVEVGKQQVQETQQVSGTVRREEARIDREGEVNVSGGEDVGWDQAMPAHRTRWQRGRMLSRATAMDGTYAMILATETGSGTMWNPTHNASGRRRTRTRPGRRSERASAKAGRADTVVHADMERALRDLGMSLILQFTADLVPLVLQRIVARRQRPG
ncbi:MAG: YsnF/AvaK domain-containing protein [Chloroflexi bacterium]|nr:YsnF/AvaK domain-containing protein [Chloroflexota bacterium]